MKEWLNLTINIPNGVSQILNTLTANSFESYIVGGCVRDALMGVVPHDWDITTNATPEQAISCFNGYRVIETGLQHGTVTIVIDDEQYEITTYRIDGEYLDNRHPSEVTFTTSLKDDLSRRDFTINAMAYSPADGLIDYFSGREDLNNKLVRCVGDPDHRFNEDALRIMRALRFASVLGFRIDSETSVSIRKNKDLLNNIAVERISVELCKLLCGVNVKDILIDYSDVISTFIPEISPMVDFEQHNPYHYLNVWEHTVQSIFEATEDIVIRLTMLFHDMGKPHCYTHDGNMGHFYGHPQISFDMCFEILKRLKFDNGTIDTVRELVLYHDAEIQPRNKHVKKWLFKIGEERFRQLLRVKYADIIAQDISCRDERLDNLKAVEGCLECVIEQQQCFSLKDLKVNGRDIIAVGVPQGVQVGIVLNKLMDMVINEEIENDYDMLIGKVAEFINV